MSELFKTYESENDERLDKKFKYNYQVIKNAYPKVSELPEDEVREIIRKYYDATGTHEDSMQAVMNYIHEKEPEWKRLYFNSNDDHNISGNVFTGINVTNTPLLGKKGKNKLLPLFFDELNKINPAYRIGDAAGTFTCS